MESKRYHAQAVKHNLRICTDTYLAKVISCCVIPLLFGLFSARAASGARVTMAWHANSEINIGGYKIYYNVGSSGPPYDSTIDIPINKLTDPNNPVYTIMGLEDNKIISIACTAYNTSGPESDLSDEVYALKINKWIIESGTPLEIILPVADFDGNTLTYTVLVPPVHGTLSGTSPNFTYTPEANYHGPDSVTFKANEWDLTVLASINGGTAMPAIPLLLLDD